MHNIWVRLNAVLFFALTVLLFLATFCAISSYLHRGKPQLSILRINTLESLRNHGGMDRALLRFDLKADLSQSFHWNIKQLFVFVVAEYESKANPLNQVIIWDKIIKSPAEAILDHPNEFVKYALIDQGAELRNKTVTLKLMFDHMPLTGRLYNGVEGESTFTLPGKYQTTSEIYNSGSSSSSKLSSGGSTSSSSRNKDKKSGKRKREEEL
jgi:signal peptidase complex subunit 3